MKAYIIVVLITFIINCFADKLIKKNYKKIGIIFLIVSLIFACYIAGIRDLTVGRDVNGYLKRLINLREASNGFIYFIKNSNSDLLFAILVYLSYFLKDSHVVLFFIELAVASPIYIYAYKNKDNVNIGVTLLVFFLTMYCYSLSMMRQSIAISLCILAYYYLREKKYGKYFSLVLIAFLFHKTALIFLITYIIYYIFMKNINHKGIIVALIIITLFILSPFLNKIVDSSSYSYYSQYAIDNSFSIGSVLKKLTFVILWLICCLVKDKDNEYHNEAVIGFVLSIIAMFCTIMTFKVPGMGRLGYYFTDLTYFLIIEKLPVITKQKKVMTILLITLLSILWWKMTAVKDDLSYVYPYKSSIIKFLNE